MKGKIFNLKGKDIWVLGGAGYLGQATVKLLHSAGAKVLCVDLEDRAQNFVLANNLSETVTSATLDLHDGPVIQQFVERFTAERGIPDGIVNLTFASTAKKLEDLNEADFDRINHGNLTATFLITRAVGLLMAKRGSGSIVLFSSMYGRVSPYPDAYESPMAVNPIEYGVGKAGILQMTKYFAVYWGKTNVRCNCISPGPFPNPTVQKDNPAFIERLEKKSPMGRIGKSEEIAGTVVFLLSEASSYITGQNIAVDGGWTCW